MNLSVVACVESDREELLFQSPLILRREKQPTAVKARGKNAVMNAVKAFSFHRIDELIARRLRRKGGTIPVTNDINSPAERRTPERLTCLH